MTAELPNERSGCLKEDIGALTQRLIVWLGSNSWNANGIYWGGKKKGIGTRSSPRTLGNPISFGLFSTASNRKTEPVNLRRPTAFQWSNLRLDRAVKRRAAWISPGTILVHPLHLGCDSNCYFARRLSPLVRRRQPALPIAPPPINRLLHRDWRKASKVSNGGCDRTGWN